jgi:hypothetical protein
MEEMHAEDVTRAKVDHESVLDKLSRRHKRILTKEKDEHAEELDQASRHARAIKMASEEGVRAKVRAEIKLIVGAGSSGRRARGGSLQEAED